MRIWDINPGYLNRQSLLGEHREIHCLISIIVNGKKGYSKHPETLRWADYGWALMKRHHLLKSEMSLRGFKEKTPVFIQSREGRWPDIYIDEPFEQLKILQTKYQNKEQGRIPLPKNAQQLWSQHKYSVMARSQYLYKKLGQEVASRKQDHYFAKLINTLIEILKEPPKEGNLRNTLLHMWGYVSEFFNSSKRGIENWPLDRLLDEIQKQSLTHNITYLISSTALSELKIWIPTRQR